MEAGFNSGAFAQIINSLVFVSTRRRKSSRNRPLPRKQALATKRGRIEILTRQIPDRSDAEIEASATKVKIKAEETKQMSDMENRDDLIQQYLEDYIPKGRREEIEHLAADVANGASSRRTFLTRAGSLGIAATAASSSTFGKRRFRHPDNLDCKSAW
jgi:hypothetical protein